MAQIAFAALIAVRPPRLCQCGSRWIRDRFTGWREFRQESIATIDTGISYVVMADISAFYENIDLSILTSDLNAIATPPEAVSQISVCLNKWAQVPGRGLPQGQSSSDILAKLYLNSIDQNLQNSGYFHLRYVDDLRSFCRSLIEAKKALVILSRLLRRRGLSLNAAKSQIVRADEAREYFDEVNVVVRSARSRFIAEVVKRTGHGDPYMNINEADQLLEENPTGEPIEIIQQAYQTYFIDDDAHFNATLFRFLLNRLGKHRNAFAVDHCFRVLESHPEESEYILGYFHSVGSVSQYESVFVELLRSDKIVYHYQRYQLVEWLLEYSINPSDKLIAAVRGIAFDNSIPRYVKTFCTAFLGKFGTNRRLL